MKRFAIVYLSTLVILLPLDFLFLGTIGKGLFDKNVNDMILATPRMAPAILLPDLSVWHREQIPGVRRT